jgi:hypothetical protein
MNQIGSGTPNPDKILKFWETKQGTVMMAVAAALGVGVFYFVGPFILIAVKTLFSTLSFTAASIVMAVVVGFLGMIATSKNFWLALTIQADKISRAVLRSTIDRDPIAAARHALDRMRKRLKQIRDHEQRINANLKRVEQQINENAASANSEFELAAQAQKQQKKGLASVHSQTAQEYQRSNLALTPTYQQMRKYSTIFAQVGESADLRIQVFGRKIDIKERELAVKKAGQAAADAARSMFAGADDELMRESMDSISDQIAAAEADMEQFMTQIMPTLQADELQRGVDADKGLEALQGWLQQQNDKPDAQSLIGSGTARLLLEAGSPTVLDNNVEREALPVDTSFDTFFSSKEQK